MNLVLAGAGWETQDRLEGEIWGLSWGFRALAAVLVNSRNEPFSFLNDLPPTTAKRGRSTQAVSVIGTRTQWRRSTPKSGRLTRSPGVVSSSWRIARCT